MLFYMGFRGPGTYRWTDRLRSWVEKESKIPHVVSVGGGGLSIGRCSCGISLSERNLLINVPSSDRSVESISSMARRMGAGIRPLIENQILIGQRNALSRQASYLVGLKGILPNLSPRWKPGVQESVDDLPPSHWITAVAEPWIYKNNGGLGFSAVAEPT